jgi:spermidine synthase
MAALLSVLFFLSGFCALIYETVWIYRFSRVFGSTVFAMSAVVAVFFAGLALGSRLFGKVAARSPRPLRMFALLELGVGAYALAFPAIIHFADTMYALLYPSIGASFAWLTVVRMLLALAVLLPPTLLMGGSLPVLLTFVVGRNGSLGAVGNRAGLLYGMNTLGAAAGSLLSGYALLNLLGVNWTNALAALLNVAVGGAALWLARTQKVAVGVPAEASAPADAAPRAPVRTVMACFGLAGFVGMSYEVLWLRYLTLYFNETVYLYSGIIAVFILGLGVGSLLCARWLSRIERPVAFFAFLQWGTGLLTIAAVYLPVLCAATLRSAGERSAALLLVILFVLLIPSALLMGAVLPVVTRIIVGSVRTAGERVGTAYALNTAGGIAGLLCSGFLLHRFLGLQAALFVLLGLNMLVAAVLLLADGGLKRASRALAPLLAGAAVIVLIHRSGVSLPETLLRQRLQPGESVLEVREGLTGITWAARSASTHETQLWENGVCIARNGRSPFQTHGFIAMLIAPRVPRDVLGLAFGGGLSYRGPRQFPEMQRLDCVDISRENMIVALRRFPENAGVADDPRARLIVDDAYSYVKYNKAAYDLILLEPTPPRYSYHAAALYTRQFYEHARRRLKPGGCFAQVLPLGELSPHETASVMRTFAATFKHCLLWRNGWDCLMVGCEQDLRLDRVSIEERLARPGVQRALRECAPLPDRYYLLDNFLSGLLLVDDDFQKAAANGDVYTDDRAGLRAATGRGISAENIRAIHQCLTPWTKLRGAFERFPDFAAKAPVLTRKREYFMALLYQHQPREFHPAFLKYIREHSAAKNEDLIALRIYLRDHGMAAEAAEVEKMIAPVELPER